MSRFLFAWVFLCVLLQYACASHSSGYVICHSQQNVQLNDPAWVKLMHVHIYISKWDISLNCLEFTDYKNVSLKGGGGREIHQLNPEILSLYHQSKFWIKQILFLAVNSGGNLSW